jgi:hypothetical protein
MTNVFNPNYKTTIDTTELMAKLAELQSLCDTINQSTIDLPSEIQTRLDALQSTINTKFQEVLSDIDASTLAIQTSATNNKNAIISNDNANHDSIVANANTNKNAITTAIDNVFASGDIKFVSTLSATRQGWSILGKIFNDPVSMTGVNLLIGTTNFGSYSRGRTYQLGSKLIKINYASVSYTLDLQTRIETSVPAYPGGTLQMPVSGCENSVANAIYTTGGYYTQSSPYTVYGSCYKFNLATGVWSTMPSLPSSGTAAQKPGGYYNFTCSFGKYLVTMGGNTASSANGPTTCTSGISVLDTSTGLRTNLTSLSMPYYCDNSVGQVGGIWAVSDTSAILVVSRATSNLTSFDIGFRVYKIDTNSTCSTFTFTDITSSCPLTLTAMYAYVQNGYFKFVTGNTTEIWYEIATENWTSQTVSSKSCVTAQAISPGSVPATVYPVNFGGKSYLPTYQSNLGSAYAILMSNISDDTAYDSTGMTYIQKN